MRKSGSGMIDLNTFLSIVNGAWTIMLAFFVVFLLHHLWEARHNIDWADWFLDQPKGAQVAAAILIADIGNWIVRAVVWAWRETGAASPLPDWVVAGIAFGALVGTVGILCKLRVFSIVRFGHAPWIACAAVTLLFVVFKLF